jgi:RND superfamily putative drug exporter
MMEIARRVRAVVGHGIRGLTGAEVLVGGFAAANLDSQNQLLRRLPGTVGFILGITAIMLFFAFRSLLVPLKAVLLNCLSVSAAFGLTVLVFQHGYGGRLFGLEGPTEAIWGVAPVLVFATVFGLSMDYEVFLLSRIKEEYDRTHDNATAVAHGLAKTARLITAAAAVMICVFGSFVLSDLRVLKLVGLGLAFAVFIDATVVRLVLVPATMELLGDRNWWFPKALAWLPHIQIEGEPDLVADEPQPLEPVARR